ncbi:hypothetical protein MFLAVUS_008379 [Mucor flavus]|uniref:Uncharacterized protein n=1 Tax=Mucor flavus TaxID=439312 RepID=A0ABP9Z723_9FUNG
MGVKADKQKICKADGIIHLAGHENLEVLVLEPAGAYGHNDHANITFDNSKVCICRRVQQTQTLLCTAKR